MTQFQCIALPAFYDGIAGPTEFIISVVDSVKMVDMPLAWLPFLDGGKMPLYIIIITIQPTEKHANDDAVAQKH